MDEWIDGFVLECVGWYLSDQLNDSGTKEDSVPVS